jgi:ATP-dependent DNA helicase RecQ
MNDAARHRNQDDFLYDRVNIMVATNAFGMGIDKSNVSFVIHYNMPKNIESYYQEAGRAGRDGERAECILLFNSKDVSTAEYLIEHSAEDSDDPETRDEMIKNNLALLREMTFYATSGDCLRARLLGYFGELAENYCGNCSNCLSHYRKVYVTVDAQKIVSCVYRLKERNLRFGKGVVTQILQGSRAERITEFHLDSLSTYGIMKETDARRIGDIMDYLVANGYLALQRVDAGARPFSVLAMTDKSREIIIERKPLEIMLPDGGVSSSGTAGGERETKDEALFGKLKALRFKLAKEAGVPAYIVFTDAALHAMCLKLPTNKSEFLAVPGVGKVKADRYAKEFTTLIKEYIG